jgi:hypothetical protein
MMSLDATAASAVAKSKNREKRLAVRIIGRGRRLCSSRFSVLRFSVRVRSSKFGSRFGVRGSGFGFGFGTKTGLRTTNHELRSSNVEHEP